MTFSETDKLKALAIVNIFETSRPFGEYAACVVLGDGAGISYGICQFTHRSGSLADVVAAYIDNGGRIGREVLVERLPELRKLSERSVGKLSWDALLKSALRSAAVTREMKDAQHKVALDRYLSPAIEYCRKHGFNEALSLAVIYDSLIHGSFSKIAVTVSRLSLANEREWITDYIRKRHLWLSTVVRLKTTTYRTKFFLDQIATGNWELRLPVSVHGYRLKAADLPTAMSSEAVVENVASEDGATTGSLLEQTGEVITNAAVKFDRVEGIVGAVRSRSDSAKSLWTAVIGTAWQTLWGIAGFITGMPREVWIVAALAAAVLMSLYLYRQIVLGRIRERTATEVT